MSNMANVSFRMEEKLKDQFETVCEELGMNMTTAFTVYATQVANRGEIPFRLSLDRPNKRLLEALEESDRIAHDETIGGYRDLDALFADLKA
jgi:DNA-damage-inducible protein J